MTPQDLLAFTYESPRKRGLEEVSVQHFLASHFSVFRRHDEPLDISRWAWHAFDTGELLL